MKYIILITTLLLCIHSTHAQTTDTAKSKVYTKVEQMPQFPGGDQGLMNYLAKNIIYPKDAKESGIEGVVYLQFIVSTDGTVQDIKVLRDPGGGCANEAIRVVKQMPRWKPGTLDGKAVKVSYTLPIHFQLSSK